VSHQGLHCSRGGSQAGQLVSRDEIVDVLWGERPPRTCVSMVHGYAAQVRALLEPGRPDGRNGRALVWARAGTGWSSTATRST